MEIEHVLTKMQKKKLDYLLEKGGECELVAVYVNMPDKSVAVIDPYGRTTWSHQDEQSKA